MYGPVLLFYYSDNGWTKNVRRFPSFIHSWICSNGPNDCSFSQDVNNNNTYTMDAAAAFKPAHMSLLHLFIFTPFSFSLSCSVLGFFLCFLPQSKRLNVFCWWLWHVKCFPNVWNKTTGKIPMITVEKHWHTHAHAHTTTSFRISGRRLWMKYAATNRTQFKLIDTSVFSPES